MQINVREAKNRLSELIRLAQAGDEVVIANRGEPVARLVPVRRDAGAPQRNLPGWLSAHPLPAHMRKTAEQIDAGIAAERAAWD
jgi:prevent-host-death family protein